MSDSEHYSYSNLLLWQRAQELAYEVIQITKQLPQTWASAVLARQIIAAATSSGANIAEGHGRYSLGAHRNHLSIARGSTAETDSWLDLLRREGLIDIHEEERLHIRCRQLMGMLTTKIKSLNEQDQGGDSTLREQGEQYHVSEDNRPFYPFTEDDYL